MIFFGNPVNFTSVTSVLIGFFSGRELPAILSLFSSCTAADPSTFSPPSTVVYSAAKTQQAKEARAKAASDIPLYASKEKN